MVLTALRGALGFLSRIPVGRDGAAWEAFRTTPAAFPVAGYLIGAIAATPLAVAGVLAVRVPATTTAFGYVLGVYLLTGINHVDGVADLGDAMVVHGDAADRVEVMKDTVVGVGATLTVALVVLGLYAGGIGVASLGLRATLLVVVAEVGAKAAMALQVCLGSAPHEGMAATVTGAVGARSIPGVAAVTAPAVAVTYPRILPAVATLAGALVVALALRWWARRSLGGVNGDVVGATNEVARVVALHAGVIAWLAT